MGGRRRQMALALRHAQGEAHEDQAPQHALILSLSKDEEETRMF